MTSYILRRISFLVPICLGILCLTFLLQVFIPSDAVSTMYQGQGTKQQTAEAARIMREKYGLDQPWYIQFANYVRNVLRGDLGTSIRTRRPVWDDLKHRYVNTLILTGASLVVAIVVGVGTGVMSAYYKDTFWDFLGQAIGLFGISMPAFFFGIVLIMIFAVHLRWVPVLGQGDWRHLILPALCLGLIEAASLSRITRSTMLDMLHQDFVRTARAKGLSERIVVLKHALRNVMLPIVNIIGLQIGGLLGGAFIIEVIFGWHGIGELAVTAIRWRDFTITQAVVLIGALTYVLVNLVVDIAYVFLDPRIKYQ